MSVLMMQKWTPICKYWCIHMQRPCCVKMCVILLNKRYTVALHTQTHTHTHTHLHHEWKERKISVKLIFWINVHSLFSRKISCSVSKHWQHFKKKKTPNQLKISDNWEDSWRQHCPTWSLHHCAMKIPPCCLRIKPWKPWKCWLFRSFCFAMLWLGLWATSFCLSIISLQSWLTPDWGQYRSF